MDEDTQHQTPDNALEPNSDKDGMFHPKTDEEHLEEDFDTPASPPDDVISKPLPADYPAGDAKLDETEVYNEGIADAEVDNREENPQQPPKRIA